MLEFWDGRVENTIKGNVEWRTEFPSGQEKKIPFISQL